MDYDWNEDKNQRNIAERGLDFGLVEDFAWKNAVIIEDQRRDYGESRFRAFGNIGDKLYALVYTIREEHVRVISLRRANNREEKIYEKTRQN